jgi:hypothetical protein
VRERSLVVLCNELKNNLEREIYIEIRSYEERRGIGWWKTGIWRLKGICPV